ncbi:hypothetical protein [Streptomyces sp. 8N706]|uniref:hypothetical protein n=1 Tax=Streptomyces sp. 8N706 TaxID=3457416 RepID=UPI003FD16CB8
MRTRIWLTSVAMGAAVLAGGAVTTAQAAPASSEAATAPGIAADWLYVGTYRTLSECQADGRSSVYEDWDCKRGASGKWQLWVLA